MNYIAKFNPYQMDEETILALATGREQLLKQVLVTLKDNLHSASIPQHLLIRGQRGMGKSFFLKYMQIHFRQDPQFRNSQLILLPEEQNNINSPADLIRLILSLAKGEPAHSVLTSWEEKEELWQQELQNLKSYLQTQKERFGQYVLVVVAENLEVLLKNIQSEKKTRSIYSSRFRHLLERIENFVLIGTTIRLDNEEIDSDYNRRLFHAFKRLHLRRWKEEDYFKYFERRIKLSEAQTGTKISFAKESLMKAKLKAISQYTGGSPRMAVVLTHLLLEDDVISTTNTLFGLIDDLTPYYQDLTKSIPKKSRILFDTLIRQGENHSQSELAKILGTSQNAISKAFSWLKENGYIVGRKRSASPAFLYHVPDRIYVLYYLQREVYHNEDYTPIWLLADFLVNFYHQNELKTHAYKVLTEKGGKEAIDMAKVYLMSLGQEGEDIPDYEDEMEYLSYVKEETSDFQDQELEKQLGAIEDLMNHKKEELILPELEIKGNALFELLKKKNSKKMVNKVITAATDLMSNHFHKSSNILLNGFVKWAKKEQPTDPRIGGFVLGCIGANYILVGNVDRALSLLQPESTLNYSTFRTFGFAILSKDLNKEHSGAFAVANKLLYALKERKEWLNVRLCLSNFFPGLLGMKLSKALFKDICEQALHLFPEPEHKIIIQAAFHTIGYLDSNKDPVYLEQLNPDMHIAVKALVQEGNL